MKFSGPYCARRGVAVGFMLHSSSGTEKEQRAFRPVIIPGVGFGIKK